MQSTRTIQVFFDRHAFDPLDRLDAALAQAVADGLGVIIAPHDPRDGGAWCTSCAWEIDVMGVYARGDTRREAVRNWMKVALRQTAGEAA